MGRKAKTHEQFVAEMAIKHPDIEVLGEYADKRTKIHLRCKRDGHKWSAIPNNLLQGRGCPSCHNKSHTKTHEQFITELGAINQNIEVLGEYVGAVSNIKVKCKIDGYEWSPKPNDVLSGTGCPKCYGNIKKTTAEFITELASINQNIEVLGVYEAAIIKVKVKCKIDGHEWTVAPSNLLRGRGCPKCAKSGYDSSKQGHFYVYAFQKYLGFGISNAPSSRHKQHKTTFKKLNIEAQLMQTFSSNGKEILDFETHLKQTLPIVNTGVEGFKTEAILYEDRELLFKAIEDFHSRHNSPLQDT